MTDYGTACSIVARLRIARDAITEARREYDQFETDALSTENHLLYLASVILGSAVEAWTDARDRLEPDDLRFPMLSDQVMVDRLDPSEDIS